MIDKTLANNAGREQAITSLAGGGGASQQMKPAKSMTTKTGSVGMGNVPPVLYGPAFDPSDIGGKLFFSAGAKTAWA
jgi:hypothetical protein